MEKYTIEDIRKAYELGARDYCKSYKGIGSFIKEDVDIFIDNLTEKEVEEEIIGFTYSFLRRKLGWEEFCDVTGVDYYARMNGYEIEDNELFKLTTSQAKKYDLI